NHLSPAHSQPCVDHLAPIFIVSGCRRPRHDDSLAERDVARALAKESARGLFDRAEKDAKDPQKEQYLGKGSRVSGKLNFDGTVQVDGHVEGEMSVQETLILGEGAVVTAQISSNTVVIKGQVTGDINARKRVEIFAPGKLFGNIVTPSLVIHEGVIFEGH